MASFIRSNISTILPIVQTQLVKFLSFPVERVLIVKQGEPLDSHPASLEGDQLALIQLQPELFNQEQVKAAGRQDGRCDRTLVVAAWSRLNIDEAYQANSWLTDASYGYLPLENLLINALLTWIPTDGNNNALAIPFHPVSITPPATTRADWGAAAVSCRVEFYRDVNQTSIFPGA